MLWDVQQAANATPGSICQPACVVRVCQRLDGIPLAIELAAARVKVLPVAQIAARLDDCFRLLSGGGRTAVPRQQSLRATIDWSYALLAELQQALFRRLAVFGRGWTLEAAEAVCAWEGISSAAVLEWLAHLVDKSQVMVEPQPHGEVRYRLLKTIRAYALERLAASGEEPVLRRRHATYYAALAAQAAPWLTHAERKPWLERLEVEHSNLLACCVLGLTQRLLRRPGRRGERCRSSRPSPRPSPTVLDPMPRHCIRHDPSDGSLRGTYSSSAGTWSIGQCAEQLARVLLCYCPARRATAGASASICSRMTAMYEIPKRSRHIWIASTIWSTVPIRK
jgi:hypothetical protein